MIRMTSPYKHKASGIYWLRKAIPSSLQPKIGKREFKESLKTRDPEEAKRLAIVKLAYWDKLLITQTESVSLTRRDIEIISQRWYAQAIINLEESDNLEEHLNLFKHGDDVCVEPMDHHLIDALEAGYKEQSLYAADDVDAFLESEGIPLQKDSDSYQALVYNFCLKKLKLSQVAYKRFFGDWTPDEQNTVLSQQKLSVSTLTTKTHKTPSPHYKPLGEAIAAYIQHKESLGEWSERRGAEVIAGLNQFLTVFDPEANPNEITRDQFRDYLHLLARTPTGLGSRKEYKGLPLKEAIKRGEAEQLPTITPQTANSKFGFISTLFSFLEHEEWVDKDRTKNIKIAVSNSDLNTRVSYTNEELNRIFKATAFADRPVDYWAPRIALMTGMRCSEILQLHGKDIRQVDSGVYVFDVNTNTNLSTGKPKRVKNTNSERLVPIPKTLIDLGFIAFVDSVGDGHLFPYLNARKDGDYTGDYGVSYNRMLHDIDVKPHASLKQLKDFHSFRHTFRANARLHGISKADADLIGGWSSDNKTSGDSYGMDYSKFISRLKRELDLIQYEGIQFCEEACKQ